VTRSTTPRRAAPNQRLEHAAWHTRQLAARTTDALEHIRAELARFDGFSTGGGNDAHVAGRDRPDRVPDHAARRYEITALREDLRDWIADLEARVSAGGHLIDVILRTRTPEPEPAPLLCRDGLHGKDLTPELTGAVVNCWEHPHKSGLCARHYQAWYRERQRRGD
jgi:hypothetical protein